MRVLQHLFSNLFVAATSVAALVHSCWSLGILFTGTQPEAGLTVQFIGWLVPSLLIAFSLDVGLLSTSNDIRNGNRSLGKFVTFAVLSASMYFLQWYYLIHHTIAPELGTGVSALAQQTVISIRDAGIWIAPLLLPLSVTLYTFSSSHEKNEGTLVPDSQTESNTVAMSADTQTLAIVPIETPAIKPSKKNKHSVACPDCDWTGSYKSARAASSALNAHRRHCTAIKSNGHIDVPQVQIGIGADGSA